MYSTNGLIKFETAMLKSSLSDYIVGYILVGAITVTRQRPDATEIAANKNDKELIFINCVPTVKVK